MLDFSKLRPDHLMFSAAVFIPSFLLQTSLVVRIFQVCVILLLYILSGRRFKPLPVALLFVAIVTANLMRPAGEVLINIFTFPITEDSLFSGISRALLLVGLIYISRISVSSYLPIPGKAGEMLGSVLFFFNRITGTEGKKNHLKERDSSLIDSFVLYFDDLLFLSDSIEGSNDNTFREREYPQNYLFYIVTTMLIIINYTLLILNFLKYL